MTPRITGVVVAVPTRARTTRGVDGGGGSPAMEEDVWGSSNGDATVLELGGNGSSPECPRRRLSMAGLPAACGVMGKGSMAKGVAP